MKLNGRAVVWPRYLDATEARSGGRRLPRRLCVERPRLEELSALAGRLGLNPEVRDKALDPRRPWERSGCMTVEKRGSKSQMLRALAEALMRERTART